jgi:hypothetical protein
MVKSLSVEPAHTDARSGDVPRARQGREHYRLFGASQVAILTSDPGLGVYGGVEVGGYVQVLLLAMPAHGVAAIPQAAPTNYSAVVKSRLDFPAECLMGCGISSGYEDGAHPAKKFSIQRASLNEAVSWVED